MDAESRKVAIIIVFILGGAIGFYIAKFFF
ncbi:MAG: hypothetical protein ACI9VM_000323 [Candidatus Azotimanducaceae bacterium]|jgi:hypothetical protein